jgi:hypothetical protein
MEDASKNLKELTMLGFAFNASLPLLKRPNILTLLSKNEEKYDLIV